MSAESPQTPEQRGNTPPSTAKGAAAGYAAVARRISSWTTNCLLTAIILVAGLGFGRQVLYWWAGDPPRPAAAPPSLEAADGLGDPWQPQVLHFGDQQWSLGRQTIPGDRAAAATALRRACRQGIDVATPAPGQPSETETRFLASLERLKPAAESAGKWQIYELPHGFPMVVGTRTGKGGSDVSIATPSTDEEKTVAGKQSPIAANLAQLPRRVVIWGLAIPMAAKVWTIYTFQPESDAGRANPGSANLPVPPEGRRLLSVQVADGGAILTLAGPDHPDAWMRFYDRWFVEHGWQAAGAWQRLGTSWHGRYTLSDPRRPETADVSFGPDGRGQCTGLLMTSISRKQTP
jgi:hypothetical protein